MRKVTSPATASRVAPGIGMQKRLTRLLRERRSRVSRFVGYYGVLATRLVRHATHS